MLVVRPNKDIRDLFLSLSENRSVTDTHMVSLSHNLYFATDCSFCAAAAAAHTQIGGCHGFLGHMRGFPVARSSRRCLDQKSRAIFIQEKESIGCRWLADYTYLLIRGFLFPLLCF